MSCKEARSNLEMETMAPKNVLPDLQPDLQGLHAQECVR
jgi:hypothetical protein